MAKKIRKQDDVVFFPTAGRWDTESRVWKVPISGVIFDPTKIKIRKKIMVRLLRRVMKVPEAEFKTPIFENRIRAFTANGLKGRNIRVRAGSIEWQLSRKSKRNGHFFESMTLTQDQVDTLIEEGAITNRVLKYSLLFDDDDNREITGRAHLLYTKGLSVISDVDDTIKDSNVGNRNELLKNTFLREFRAIGGMAGQYRRWFENGADLHFVSASPWQLITPLSELLREHDFPLGTIDLRVFRWRDQVYKRVVSEKWVGKGKVIRSIIRQFPDRQFVLVGDSVERDPELYAHMAEEFSQVKGVYIRQVPGFEMDEKRVLRIRSQIQETGFQTFSDSDELPSELPFEEFELQEA